MNKYEKQLYNSAIQYGELIKQKDLVLSYVEKIINQTNDEFIILLLKNISYEIDNSKESIEIKDRANHL